MYISIKREDLLRPITIIAGVVERRQTLPILSYALLKQQNGALTLTGTDLEIEVTAIIAGQHKNIPEMTIPARKLLDICRALPPETEIKISKQGEKISISAGKSKFTLLTLPTNDFPTIGVTQTVQKVTLQQKTLKSVLEQTHFCMAQQDVRYYLNGLYLELSPKSLRAVATDGHRMATSEIAVDEEIKTERQVIVPRKGVQELIRLLGNSEEPVSLEFGANHVGIDMPDIKFTSKLIDGKFPDYNKVIPNVHTKIFKLRRDEFRDALTRVSILANEKYRGIRLALGSERLSISAHNPEQEEAAEEINYDYQGEPLEIGFNVNYLIDAAAAIATEEIEVILNDANSSCVLHEPDNKATQYIIMPMRL